MVNKPPFTIHHSPFTTIMQTTLCFDFGNTRLKCAVFEDRNFKEERILFTAEETSIQELINEFKPDKAILSSVINHPLEIEGLLAKHTQFHKLDHNSKLPLTTPVGKPETIRGRQAGHLCRSG